MKIGFSPAIAYCLVIILLLNITNCLQRNQTSKRLNIASPTLDEYLYIDQDLDKEETNDCKVF